MTITDVLNTCSSCKKPISFGIAFCPLCGQEQPVGTGPLWLGERRLVTILFADLASFTAASEKSDPEDVIDMLNQVFTRLMVECDREGGYLDKIVGDQLMVLFGAPRSHEDDPVRAVRAALAMQEAMKKLVPTMREKVGTVCKLNIGVNTGIVMWGQVGPRGRAAPTVIGDAVNLASRLQHFATNGQIIVSDAVYFLTRRFFDYEILEPIQVKGKSKLIPVYVPTGPSRSLRMHKHPGDAKTPLLERDQALQSLHAHWARTIAGQGKLILIRGTAGMGKSRLLAEFLQGLDSYVADKSPLFLQTRSGAKPGDYFPLANLLSQLFALKPDDTELARRQKVKDRAQILGINDHKFLPLIGYLLGWYENDMRLSEADHELQQLRVSAFDIASILFIKQSIHRPTLLVIDDLQWADTNTLQWLARLTLLKQTMQRENMGHRLMIVLASRPHMAISTDSIDEDQLLELAPLGDTARHELIAYLLPDGEPPPSVVQRLSQESGGNPFFIEEATRGLVQTGQLIKQNAAWHLTRAIDQIVVPPSVEGLIMANLDSLAWSYRTVLQYASVIGMNFGYGLISAITPVDDIDDIDEALVELVTRGFIREISGTGLNRTFAFTQVMMRQVAYQSLLRKTRRDLHQQIARLTDTEAVSGGQDVELLAHHYAEGGNEAKAIVYNWLAGRHAFEQFDYKNACRHLEIVWQSLRTTPAPDMDIYRNVANALGDASTFTGNFSQAAACYQMLQDHIGDNAGEQAVLHFKVGRLYFYQNDLETAQKFYQSASELAVDNPTLTAQLETEVRLLYDFG